MGTENPYQPTSHAHPRKSSTQDKEEVKQTFRWQVIPCLLSVLFALFWGILLILALEEFRELSNRWDRRSSPVADSIIACLLGLCSILLVASQLLAARSWIRQRYFAALLFGLVGVVSLIIARHADFSSLQFLIWDITQALGWDEG
ncbi:hypothetical protein [Novipirellula artificiosorum]|uniref:Uncharacterized protein n=1 Tax=Novipirellula artificiosorum TaxID=2528016 RepID=A0A5C6DFK0_9BACT|nr:hypothetical protein [Novipirellula artificiosorum]TWU36033.1 hypothetical protein Poly41_37860 [Novipirellula artificiosorum]